MSKSFQKIILKNGIEKSYLKIILEKSHKKKSNLKFNRLPLLFPWILFSESETTSGIDVNSSSDTQGGSSVNSGGGGGSGGGVGGGGGSNSNHTIVRLVGGKLKTIYF